MLNRLVPIIFAGLFVSSSAYAASPTDKVSVSATGQVTLNGVPTNLHALDVALAKLSAEHGVVWYYREAAEAEPPSQAMDVVKLVVKHSLPISMSSKPDFSDAIDANGHSIPRKP